MSGPWPNNSVKRTAVPLRGPSAAYLGHYVEATMTRFAPVLLLGILVVGCTQTRPKPPHPPFVPAATAAECEKSGGDWMPWAPLQKEPESAAPGNFCNPRTTDSGKVCSNPSQCQGNCLAPKGSFHDEPMESGTCSSHVLTPFYSLWVGHGYVREFGIVP